MNAKRNYPLLLVSQFLGALGDNVILMVILGQLTFRFRQGEITEAQLGSANAVYTSLLFVPFFLLAPLAGFLNDRFPKTYWLLGGNGVKFLGTLSGMLAVMAGGAVRDWGQGIGYLIVGIGACIYSPAKYGILPEVLPAARLVKANGTIEMLTLVAILAGSIVGAQMIDHLSPQRCYLILLGIYGASSVLNALMAKTPHDPRVSLQRSLGEFFGHFRDLVTAPRLGRVLLGTTLFWVAGATMKMNFQPWGLKTLGLADNTAIALLGLWLSVGVMAGSLLAGQLHRLGELRSTRGYGFGLAAVILLLGLVGGMPSMVGWRATLPGLGSQILPVVVLLALAGVFAGLFLIPLNASLQGESDSTKLGKTIAVQNFLENLAMSLGGGCILIATRAGLGASQVFIGLAIFVALAVAWLRIPQHIAPPVPLCDARGLGSTHS